jgi:hypothetical protein
MAPFELNIDLLPAVGHLVTECNELVVLHHSPEDNDCNCNDEDPE